MNRIRWYGPSIVLLITVLVVMITGPRLVRNLAFAQTDARITLVQDALQQNPSLAELSDAFRKVATVVEPSVVHIQVLSRARPQRSVNDPNEMLRRFFGRPEGEQMPFGPGAPQPEQEEPSPYERYDPARPTGNGSGWVYDNQGHIITNNHVVEGADEIKVRFQDGSEYTAQVVGADPSTDVAVLRIDGDNLHPATVAKDQVEAGDIVFAFGSPFGFEFSMSQGVVSAKGRTRLGIIGGNSYENFIQTDAAINPGNSGGPLTNIYGEVIGMNTAIASRAPTPWQAGFMGIGFAIPVDMVTDVADEIIANGKVQRGYLGIYIRDLEPKMARTFGFEENRKGVLVDGPTEENSPASKAGIEAGDIVTEVNGKPVSSADELRYTIAQLDPGTNIELTIFRDGETQTKSVTLGELPGQALASARPSPGGDSESRSAGMDVLEKYGVEGVQNFDRQTAERMNAPHRDGVLITSVRMGSIAYGEGLRRGMLISDVQGKSVTTVEELVDEIERHDATRGIRLRVQVFNPESRDFAPRFVLLELPKED